MSNEKVVKKGISLPSVLGVVFIILKLTGVIDWSWVWVLAPFWMGIAFVIIALLIILLIAVLANL